MKAYLIVKKFLYSANNKTDCSCWLQLRSSEPTTAVDSLHWRVGGVLSTAPLNAQNGYYLAQNITNKEVVSTSYVLPRRLSFIFDLHLSQCCLLFNRPVSIIQSGAAVCVSNVEFIWLGLPLWYLQKILT